MIQRGDKDAIQIFKEYNSSLQPSFEHLSNAQIISIYNYIDSEASLPE